jgi:hypothetical protein
LRQLSTTSESSSQSRQPSLEAAHARRRHDELARPAHAVPVGGEAARGSVEGPAEVDSLVGADDARRALQSRVVEVLAEQPRHRPPVGDGAQLCRGDDDVRRRGATRAGRVAHHARRAEPRAHAVEDRDRPVSGAAVAAQPRLDGIGADDGDRAQRAGQRERAPLVLQEHHRPARRLAGEGAVVGMAVPVGGAVRIRVRMLEEPQLELRPQHARDARVDHGVRDHAAAERLPVRPVLRERRLEDDVETRLEGVLRGGGGVGLGHVQHRRAARRRGIGDHESVESPRLLQRLREQPAVLRGG